jgi:hypothetical protein
LKSPLVHCHCQHTATSCRVWGRGGWRRNMIREQLGRSSDQRTDEWRRSTWQSTDSIHPGQHQTTQLRLALLVAEPPLKYCRCNTRLWSARSTNLTAHQPLILDRHTQNHCGRGQYVTLRSTLITVSLCLHFLEFWRSRGKVSHWLSTTDGAHLLDGLVRHRL